MPAVVVNVTSSSSCTALLSAGSSGLSTVGATHAAVNRGERAPAGRRYRTPRTAGWAEEVRSKRPAVAR